MQLIKKEEGRAINAPDAISQTGAARPQTMQARTASIAGTDVERKASQSAQNGTKPASVERRGDTSGAGNAPKGETSAEQRPERPQSKQFIDGIDAEVYRKLVNEVGAPARRRKNVDADLAEKMHRAGWSYAQIAKHFKVSPCTVRRRLGKSGRRS